jgi:hypothetical protein
MVKIFFYCVLLLTVLFLAYAILRYLYGKDHKKWEPLVFVKKITFKSILFSKNKTDQKKKNG